MKSTVFAWFCKAVIAGSIALIVLTGFCFLYSNSPIHFPCADGATDYHWEPNTFYSSGGEGFAWGRTNNEGYYDTFDYTEGMPVDVLIMGSSHMEAGNVFQRDSTASVLNAALEDKTVYNIGVSGHTLLTCFCNLPAALKKYRPASYVVLETSQLSFSEQELQAALDGTIPEIADHSSGIIGWLSQNQFLRLSYKQIKNFMTKSSSDAGPSDAPEPSAPLNSSYLETLNTFLARIAEESSSVGAKAILFYHPPTALDSNGCLLLPEESELKTAFSTLCTKNGIVFLDMSECFREAFVQYHILPHGFSNSSIGSGHLNQYGHRLIADELYKIIH